MHNDTKGGHPSLIINKKDNRTCYVSKNAIVEKRNNFSSKEWNFLRIYKDDKNLINYLKWKNKNKR